MACDIIMSDVISYIDSISFRSLVIPFIAELTEYFSSASDVLALDALTYFAVLSVAMALVIMKCDVSETVIIALVTIAFYVIRRIST